MRFLAIDLGDKRTGLALGDDETGPDLVMPAGLVETPIATRDGQDLVDAITRAAHEHLGRPRPGASPQTALVLGLPLNMDGTESPRSKQARDFAARVGAATGLPIQFQDERLTSVDAEWSLNRTGLTHGQKKKRRDALAAAAILRDFLRARRGDKAPPAGGGPPDHDEE